MSQEVVESQTKCVHFFFELVASGLALLALRAGYEHKKSVHSLTSTLQTLQLKSWNVATNVILFAFIRTYRAKKEGRKETKKNRRFTKIFLRWKRVIIIAWHFRAFVNSSKIGRLGNAHVRNTRLYELSYFRYCQLLLPQSSSPNNNNFPSVLMAHCFVKEREASFLLKVFKIL